MTVSGIRTVVADDSPTFRALLASILTPASGFEIVGEAADGADAVRLVYSLRPDLVVMDIRMPRLDGFAATRRIMAECPTPVVIVSALSGSEVVASLDALAAGALTLLPKPAGPAGAALDGEMRSFVRTLRAMAGVKVVRRWALPRRPVPGASEVPTRVPASPPVAVGVAASTGGPGTLRTLLGALPASFQLPILVVQHMTGGFAEGLAQWLDRSCPLRVKLAEHGEPLAAGTVYVAPTDRHLGVRAGPRAVLSRAPEVGGFRPSATHLFQSLAEVLGSAAAGVVLTGMGRDGVHGLRALHDSGGLVVAQDPSSCVVYGMPAAAVTAGVVDVVLPIEEIAGTLLWLGAVGR